MFALAGAVLSDGAFNAWGWRATFWLSLGLVIIGMIVRLRVTKRARAERITQAEMLMGAVTSQRADLTKLIDDIEPQTQADALFMRRPRTGDTPTYVALSLRTISGNGTALDELPQRKRRLQISVLHGCTDRHLIP